MTSYRLSIVTFALRCTV